MMEPSFEILLVLPADANVDFVLVSGLAVSLQGYVIGWKEKSVRDKDRLDAMALRRLLDDPAALD